MLIVGFGAGVTAGTFVTYPEIERIVICEIEPLIPQKIAGHFSEENFNVVNDPRVQIVYDDARHFVLTTNEQVRHHHQRPDSSVGQGRCLALYAGVFRAGEAASEAGRNGHAMGSAL